MGYENALSCEESHGSMLLGSDAIGLQTRALDDLFLLPIVPMTESA